MKKLTFTIPQKKRASARLALGVSELEAAETLLEKYFYREAVVHMYFCFNYVSQTLLTKYLTSTSSHKQVNSELHTRYGKFKTFPRSYVELHTFLWKLRTEFNYRTTHVPSPSMLKSKIRNLSAFVKFALRKVPRVDITDIIKGIYEENKFYVKDICYDIYCPKTYSHHTRLTFWQPPFYLDIYSPKDLQKRAFEMLKSLKVRRPEDYVVGMNSRVDQYKETQLIMLDIDSVDAEVESALKKHGGILIKTGRGFHFIGKKIINLQKEWIRSMKGFKQDDILKKYIDSDHIDISIRRGYSTLRITDSPVKPYVPFFYKEL